LQPHHATGIDNCKDEKEYRRREQRHFDRGIAVLIANQVDAPRPGIDDDAGAAYGDSIGSDDERYELVELDVTVAAVLGHIPPRERMILKMRFVEDLTQTEIAERVGISQMQVSRLLRRSLNQLRTLTRAPGDGR